VSHFDPLHPDYVVARLAERAGLTVDQAKAFLQAQAELVCECDHVGYPLAGLGRFRRSDTTEREMTIAFGERKGEKVVIPATQRLKFVVMPLAVEVAFGRAKMPNVFELDWSFPDNEPVTD